LHHRWIELKRQMLGLKNGMRLSDLSAPLPGDGEIYKVETSRAVVDAAFQTLPASCRNVVQRAFDERWIDFFPKEDKYTGAYTYGAYDVHPFLLLNYHEDSESVAELAHEMGHAIHMTLGAEAQPFAIYSGDVLISELAATVTEILFHEHQLKSAVTEKQRLAALSQYLEFFSGTFFDQMLATEFELKAHEMSEVGEDLSAESLKTLWSGLTGEYYGQAYEVTSLDGYDWMRYQHLYWELYMYKYATGLVAGYPLAMAIDSGDQDAAGAYLRLLSAGGSKTGAELLKEEAFDFTSEDLYKSFFDRYRELLDELELLVDAAS
jgi:oligoendopeptidase F